LLVDAREAELVVFRRWVAFHRERLGFELMGAESENRAVRGHRATVGSAGVPANRGRLHLQHDG
jgi:hypothetical protein